MKREISVRKLARFVSVHPNRCLALAFLLTALAAWRVPFLKVEMDVAALLPEDSDVVQVSQAALAEFGNRRNFDFMLAVIEARNEEGRKHLYAAAEELAFALDYDAYIWDVLYELKPDSLNLDTPEGRAQAVALLTEEDWDAIESKFTEQQLDAAMRRLRGLLIALPRNRLQPFLDDPLNFYELLNERVKIKSGPLQVNLRDNHFVSEDGHMLLMLAWPQKPASDLAFAQELKEFLDGSVKGVFVRNPQFGPPDANISIGFIGPHYEAIADSALVKRDLFRTSIISSVAVVALFIFAFRRPEALVFFWLPFLVGVVWTLGFASVTVGRLTQVTMAIAAVLAGMGVDFSVHIYVRYLEESERGKTNQEAIRLAMVETGPAIMAGGFTTALAFFGMCFTRFEGFRELGLIAGTGILFCVAAVFLVLPPILAYFGRGATGTFTSKPIPGFGLKNFYFAALAYPRVSVAVALVVTGWFGLQATKVGFEEDFRYLKQPSVGYQELRKRLESHFDVPANQLVVIASGDTAEEALEDNDRLFSNIVSAENAGYRLVAKDSLRYFIPSQETQRRSLSRLTNRNLAIDQTTVNQVAARYRISPSVFEPFFKDLADFQKAATEASARPEMPITLNPSDPESNQALIRLAWRYIYRPQDGRWRILTQVYPPPAEEWIGSVPEPFVATLGQGLTNDVEVTGSAILQQELRRMVLEDLARSVLIVLALVTGWMAWQFRSALRTVLAIFPVIMSMLVMLGVVHLLGMKLHYVNIIAFPIMIAIGVDSAIHVITRYYEQERRDLKHAVTRTGKAVVITGMTTIFGLGALALAEYRGMKDLGILSIIGSVATLLGAILVLPALLRMVDPDAGERQSRGDDLG